LAWFLASDDASNITGAEFVVDGGLTGAPAGAPVYRAWCQLAGKLGSFCSHIVVKRPQVIAGADRALVVQR
jgi:hypothetical protein